MFMAADNVVADDVVADDSNDAKNNSIELSVAEDGVTKEFAARSGTV